MGPRALVKGSLSCRRPNQKHRGPLRQTAHKERVLHGPRRRSTYETGRATVRTTVRTMLSSSAQRATPLLACTPFPLLPKRLTKRSLSRRAFHFPLRLFLFFSMVRPSAPCFTRSNVSRVRNDTPLSLKISTNTETPLR